VPHRKPEKLYVIETDPRTQRVTVGANESLHRSQFAVREVNWISIAPPSAPVRAEVRIRNRHQPAWAAITPGDDPARVQVAFDTPQRAVTPGQGAVFYSGDLVLGGGWIE
jgi:tRNA-uridine 2-sulfurtransferase